MTQQPPTQSAPVQSRTTRKAAPVKSEDVKCAQCGGINGHESDCPTKQPKQAEGKVIEPTKTAAAWFYVDSIKENKTKIVEKNGKKTGGIPFVTFAGNVRGKTNKIDVHCFHKTVIENAAILKGAWVEMEVQAKPSPSDASRTLYSLERVLNSEDENGMRQWIDNRPMTDEEQMQELQEGGMTAEDAGFDTP